MKVLVTGGAGYIGSVVVDHLIRNGNEVVVLDNLSHGRREVVPEGAKFIEGGIHDRMLLRQIFEGGIDAVMHFAALIEAGDSMKNPTNYFENNVVGSFNLFSEAVDAGVNKVIFSSTAAVYQSKDEPITETDLIMPANVYGQTKRMIEEMLLWYNRTKNLNVCIFRYFNAAGASMLENPPQRGESHIPESHIIPNILDVALGKKPEFVLFGNDYPTKGGTCIRDYIHIDDLATAHLLGLEKLKNMEFSFDIFNLGNGYGYTNLEVIEAARRVTAREIAVKIIDRRPGDAARLVASSQKAQDILGWTPKHRDIEEIVKSAWIQRLSAFESSL